MTETSTLDDKLKKLRVIVKALDICMPTTMDARDDLHSRPMSNNREIDFNGDRAPCASLIV